jgi:integrase
LNDVLAKFANLTVLSWEQLAAALAKLGIRDRILLKLDMTNALRPSELFAFRWKCHRVEAVSLTIVEMIYKGKIRPYGKTKGSLTEVPIAKDLSDDLTAWRQASQVQYDKKKKKHGFRSEDSPATTGAEYSTPQRCARIFRELPRK